VFRHGAGFRMQTEDFLVADDPHFHPTDVLEDADGSLLVVDTGGWFRIGCPTSKIAQPEFKGAIYRVRRADAPALADPRGLKLAWDTLAPGQLAAQLDDPRFAVRDRAVHLLGKRGAAALPALEKVLTASKSVRATRNAVWALTRMDLPEARALVRRALNDADLSVRLAAIHSAGLHRDQKALKRLIDVVEGGASEDARQAALALARLGKGASVPALLDTARRKPDPFLDHAVVHALIQIADREKTVGGLRDPAPRVRRAALLALDQMKGGGLTRAR
jgi:hypothetical protein